VNATKTDSLRGLSTLLSNLLDNITDKFKRLVLRGDLLSLDLTKAKPEIGD
jgi:hypothetical protein